MPEPFTSPDDEVEQGEEEGLPRGDKGKLPWRDYARGGQGLREKSKGKERLRVVEAVKKRTGKK